MFKKIFRFYRAFGIKRTSGYIYDFCKYKLLKRKFVSYNEYQHLFLGKDGLEIGGPSNLYKNNFPIYQLVNSIDNCNFSRFTIWEGELTEGDFSISGKRKGRQYIQESTKLEKIKDHTYDFLLSCHSLEHTANPLKAMNEFIRVVKKGGLIVLVLPDKNYNFDHKREVTTFNHLKNDFLDDISENDNTHYNEIITKHDLSLDSSESYRSLEEFRKICDNNEQNRQMHHHIFDGELLKTVFDFLHITILFSKSVYGNHIIIGRTNN